MFGERSRRLLTTVVANHNRSWHAYVSGEAGAEYDAQILTDPDGLQAR